MTNKHDVAYKYAMDKIQKLDQATANILKGEARGEMAETTLNITQDLGEKLGKNSTVQLVNSSTKREKGVNDFQGEEISDTTVIDSISFGFSTQANSAALGEGDYKNDKSVPAVIKNSIIRFSQDSQRFEIPVRRLIVPADATIVAADELELKAPRLFLKGGPIEVELISAGNYDAGAGNSAHLNIKLHGFSFRSKG